MGTLLEHSPRAHGRVLMAHLGGSASLCATRGGRSVATTMGFSSRGLMMGCAQPAATPACCCLMEQGWGRPHPEAALQASGLLGVSGISAGMRRLRADGSPAARRAIDQFTYRVVRESGAMVACMGGLDVLAFSGGIGEHDAQVRAQVCEQLGWMGVRMDAGRNASAPGDAAHAIHAEGSAVEVWELAQGAHRRGPCGAREAARLLYQEDDAPTPVPLPEGAGMNMHKKWL